MYEGWFALGGQEIANNERYAAYAALLGLPTPRDGVRCPKLPEVLDDDPYAAMAGSPWHDTAAPESDGFAGLFVHNITGLDSSTSTRSVVELSDEGGLPTAARSSPRTVQVTAFLAGTTDAALRYGIAWLDAALHDDCEGVCTGATLCMLATCPDCVLDEEGDADDCWALLARTLHDVVVVDGPKVVAYHDLSGSCSAGGAVGATVEFTMVAAMPHIYRTPLLVGDALTFTPPVEPEEPGEGEPPNCRITWVPVGPGRGSCPKSKRHRDWGGPPKHAATPDPCEPPEGCLVDPLKGQLPELPRPAQLPGDLARAEEAWAATVSDPDLLPRWLDSVPVVTIAAGGENMRRLTLRFYDNPLLTEIEHPDDVDECSALAEINVSLVPRDTTLVIDGRSQEAYLICPGGSRQVADSVVFGRGGAAFDWPRLTCGAALSVVALVDASHYDEEATVDVQLAARQDLA